MTRIAVVTGAASGIGAATADRFREAGWDVLGIDLRADEGIVAADVADEQSLEAAARRVPRECVDALVCAAGIWHADDDRYSAVSLEAWQRTWQVNVTGTMLTLRTFAGRLRRGAGVVTVASIAALQGMPRRDAYTASKGAVVALTRAWAADLIRRGIRVNCICPGVTDTPMTESALAAESVALPLGRAASPAEIAQVITAVADPAAAYLNGAVIPVDGGLTTTLRTVSLAPRDHRPASATPSGRADPGGRE